MQERLKAQNFFFTEPGRTVNLSTKAQRQQLLVEWNDTASDYPRDRCVHELFEEQAERTPEATAVLFGDQQLTYRQLNEHANQLAHHLLLLGVKPDTLVGICLERSINMIVGLLGILKAGGAYVPLDPTYPHERLAFIFEDARPMVILTQNKLRNRFPCDHVKIICLEAVNERIYHSGNQHTNGIRPQANHLAYVIYTSGSTGQPKGVAIEHLSAVNFIYWAKKVFSDAEMAGVLAATSICFDLSVFELFVTLSRGGKIILAENALELPHLIAKDQITLINTVPSAIAELVKNNSIPVNVQVINLAGEPLTTALVDQIYALGHIRKVNDLYGPTETTTYSTFTIRQSGAKATIGRPIANTRCYVLDEGLAVVPVGVVGELHIGGDGLARGYLNRPELTAERFIADPFSPEPGARLYKTGDLVRYLPDGNLEFLGRRDQQVKIRGFRIEPGEIEAVLAIHPKVRQAAVIAREDVPGNKALVAYLVVREEPAPTVTELRDFLLARLPDYMVPAAFVPLEKLPLTPNGKLDRNALPAPAQNRLGAAAPSVAPQTPTQTALAKIWADLLGIPSPGIHDNFFALGGHSLLAVRMIFRIRETFKIGLPVRAIFEFPTLAKLARVVDGKTFESDSPLRLVRRDRSAADGRFAASYGQEQLWFLDQLEPGSSVYNVPLAIRLRGPLNQTALQRSLDHLVQRHEVLRTTFVAENGVPRQVVAPHLDVKLAAADLEKIPAEERERELQRRLLAAAGQPFDLSRGPLLRAELFGLSPTEHVLLLTVHHIIFDGWSVEVWLRELAASYAAFCDDRIPELPGLPVQYVDFAAWQRHYLTTEKVEQHLGYWRRQLAGVPTIFELPATRPRPQVADHEGAHQPFTLPPELTTALRQLSQAQGTTLFVTLLAAFQTLLHRFSGQQQILVGSPLSGRTLAECEELIGFFANVLPLKADFSNHPLFTELVQQLHQTVWEAQDHQELPFERLVQDLHPQRGLGRNPIFQIVFIFESEPLPLNQMGPVKLERENLRTPIVKFDLTLSLSEKNGSLHGIFEYATQIFDPADISRLLAGYQNLLAAIVADTEQPVSRLPLLSPVERHRLVVEWNDTASDYPRDRCVHELFEEQAERTPEATAVLFGDQQLTYRQLNEHANQLAHHLLLLGVKPDTLVGILVDRSAEYLIGVLGILKAGGAYLPLDRDYPAARLQFMLADADAKVLVTHQPLPADLDRRGITVMDLERDAALIGAGPKHNPGLHNTPEQLAYVIYTSGSTGQPKGVAIPHRGVVRLVRGQSYAKFDARQRFLLLASTSFDAATFETWGPLLNGAVCVVFPRQPLDFEQLETIIRQQRITCLWLTAGLFNQIIDARPSVLETVEQVLTGGEALSVSHVQKAMHLLPRLQLINGYGPTESTTFACCYAIEPKTGFATGSVPIGRPIANTRCYVLDEGLAVVPVGVVGELHIGGDGLARGYLNRPELTAERFIADPFSPEPGARLYKTGDLVRYLPDGNLEFLGRRDQQVKIRGFRIEPGEIEAVLAIHPKVRQAAVIAREDVPGNKALVAYLVVREEPAPTVTELRDFLLARLPDYMVPAAFVPLEKLPLTPNGKLDRNALPAPAQNRLGAAAPSVAPQTPTQTALAKIWADLLGIPSPGIHDNFFALGGHSLLAVRMIFRIRETFKIGLPVRAIFEFPTLAKLARVVDGKTFESDSPLRLVRRDRSAADGRFAASYGQEQLWFLDQLEPGSSVYNVPLAIRLRGPLNQTALQRSLDHLVQRHEVLRTTFVAENGVPRQVVAPHLDVKLAAADLEKIPAEERERELQRRLLAAAGQPFDLSRGPLLRAELFGLSPTEHVLLLTVHHIIFDGWSVEVWLRELAASYAAFCDDRIPELPGLPVQYVDFAAWQRHYLTTEKVEQHLGYWRRQLAGVPTIFELPATRPRPQVADHEGAHQPFTLPPELTTALRQLSQAQGTTLFVTLLAAFQTLLHRFSGQQQILVGSPLSGRTLAECEELIGFFANVLPLKADFSNHPLFTELVQQLHQTVWEAQDHQELPFERLVQDLHPQRGLGRNPIFQIVFIFESEPLPLNQMGPVKLERENLRTPIVKFDLTLSLSEKNGSLHGIFEYATQIFDPADISRLLAGYQNLLAAIVADTEQPVSRLPLLSPVERHRLVVEWNDTASDYPRDRCVHELFEEQAERTPEATAVLFGDQQLTYRQLNEHANQLAHHLLLLGVKPDTLVGICLERSINMIVGLLGILKAGGAYVPLDPTYPHERLAFMIEDSSLTMLVTQSSLLDLCLGLNLGQSRNTVFKSFHIFCLETRKTEFISPREKSLRSSPTSKNLAYVIFTSGSTGKPKGVMIEHYSLVNHLDWRQRTFPAGGQDRFLQKASLSFDISIWEIFTPLISGAQLILPKADGHKDPAYLVHLMAAHKITMAHFGPALLQAIVDEPEFSNCKSLRQVFCGGEPLLGELQKHFFALTTADLISQYGPTESTIDSTWYQCRREVVQAIIPIGRPIANTRCYVLDEGLAVVPVGVVGELHIGGDGLARGYLNRPELTAERFIADPFSPEPGARLYKTGDLVRYLPDGNLEFLGRRDQQVKIRGFRIEPGEIEAVLAIHPKVRQAAVIAREDVPGNKALVAYLVVREEPAPTVTELRDFLLARLPDYMVPAAFVPLEKLPLTPNGKLDRNALPAPAQNRLGAAAPSVAPQTPTQTALAKIWADLLGIPSPGIHDNFFALGGHSLLAVRVVSEIKRQMNLDLPVRTLFQHPTIQELSGILSAQNYKINERKSELIQLQPGKAGPELFFIIDEGSLGLFKLARLIDSDLPIYTSVMPLPEEALQASRKRQLRALPRMEDLAAGHVALIKSRQTTGPILLAGHCFGGMLAFEVAQQLQASGIQVQAVLLLDTWMENPKFWWRKRAWLQEHFGKLLSQGPLYVWHKSQRRIKLEKAKLASRLELAVRDDFSVHVPWEIIVRIYKHALEGYRPKPLASRGILYLSQDDWLSNAYRSLDDSLGAGKMFADGVKVINVPGNHVTLLDEGHLSELADSFKKSLETFCATNIKDGMASSR
ncbi:MAG: amino acid adenylation domain-containing protein [Limisphaerales bacterium]